MVGYNFYGVFNRTVDLIKAIDAEHFKDPETGEVNEESFRRDMMNEDIDMLDYIAGIFIKEASDNSDKYDFFYVIDSFGNIPFIYNGFQRRYTNLDDIKFLLDKEDDADDYYATLKILEQYDLVKGV